MPDREKVIRGLENCRNCSPVDGCPKECPYWTNENPTGCCTFVPLLDDALALLRDPVEPKPTGIEPHYLCGECGLPILNGDTFCKWCGKNVKWDV